MGERYCAPLTGFNATALGHRGSHPLLTESAEVSRGCPGTDRSPQELSKFRCPSRQVAQEVGRFSRGVGNAGSMAGGSYHLLANKRSLTVQLALLFRTHASRMLHVIKRGERLSNPASYDSRPTALICTRSGEFPSWLYLTLCPIHLSFRRCFFRRGGEVKDQHRGYDGAHSSRTTNNSPFRKLSYPKGQRIR